MDRSYERRAAEEMTTVNITLDGKKVEGREGRTILETAREHGMRIPTLCYHKDLSPTGNCRMCVVEVTNSRFLQAALELKTKKEQLPAAQYARQARMLEARLDELIDIKRKLTDPDNLRFASRLRKHRSHILRFLYVDELDATNNLAERQLRPAVITRKTNGCNRTKEGVQIHAILGSVLATCQHAIPILDYLIKLQKFGETPPSLTDCILPDT